MTDKQAEQIIKLLQQILRELEAFHLETSKG